MTPEQGGKSTSGPALSLAVLAELVSCGASARRLLAAGELRIDPQVAAAKVLDLLVRIPCALLNARTAAAAARVACGALLSGSLSARHVGRFARRVVSGLVR